MRVHFVKMHDTLVENIQNTTSVIIKLDDIFSRNIQRVNIMERKTDITPSYSTILPTFTTNIGIGEGNFY